MRHVTIFLFGLIGTSLFADGGNLDKINHIAKNVGQMKRKQNYKSYSSIAFLLPKIFQKTHTGTGYWLIMK